MRLGRALLILAFLALVGWGSTPAGPRGGKNVEHLRELGVESWHRSGWRGQGVKVAILDTGFRGYREFEGRFLPNNILTKTLRTDGDLESRNSQHGILCAEIVHALAPDAELMLVSWQPDSPDSFVRAIDFAKNAGAKIITCSVIMPCWSDGEGGGPTHAALRPIIGSGYSANDLLCVTCAGNLAKRHWSGAFNDDGQGNHRWPGGASVNHITAFGDEAISAEVFWPGRGAYSLRVADEHGREVGRAQSTAMQPRSAVVRFLPRPKGTYMIQVRHDGGPAGPFHLAVLGASLTHHAASGSIPFPGDGPEWFTVGAWENGRRAEYSSCGPNSAAPKPDVVAAVPLASAWRPQPFGGTSAAAPQAAGLAALYWSKNPKATANEIRTVLRIAARDVHDPGFDYETGFGLLRLPDERSSR
jgi:subtilisin family serine protease